MYRHARIVLQECFSNHPLTQHRSRSLSNETTPGAKSPQNESTSKKIQIQKASSENNIHGFAKGNVLVLYTLLCNRLLNPFLDLMIPGIKREDQLTNLTDFRKGKWPRHGKGVGLHYSKCSEEPTPFKLKKALEIEDCIIKDPRLVFKVKNKIRTDIGKFFPRNKRLVKQKAKDDELEDLSSLWYKIFLKRSVDSKVESVTPNIHGGQLGRLSDFRAYDDAFSLGHTHMKEESCNNTLISHSLSSMTGLTENANEVQVKNDQTSRTSLRDGVENQGLITGIQNTPKGTQTLHELKPEQKKCVDSNDIIEKNIESSNKGDLNLPTSSNFQEIIEQSISVQNTLVKDSETNISHELGESSKVLFKGTKRTARNNTVSMKLIPSSVNKNAAGKTKVNKNLLTSSEVRTKNSIGLTKEMRKNISINDKEVSRKVDINPINQSIKGIAIKSKNKEEITKMNTVKKNSNVELSQGQISVKHTENKTNTLLTNKNRLHSSKVSTAASRSQQKLVNKVGFEDKPSRHTWGKMKGKNIERERRQVNLKSSEIVVKSIKLKNVLDEDRSFNEKRRFVENKKSANKNKLTNTTDKPKFSVKRNFKLPKTPKAKEKKKMSIDNSPKPKLVIFKTKEKEAYFETKDSNFKGVSSELINIKNVIESEGEALKHKHTNVAQNENKEVKPTNHIISTEVNQKHSQQKNPANSINNESAKGSQLQPSAVDVSPKQHLGIQHQNQVDNNKGGFGDSQIKQGLTNSNVSNSDQRQVQKQVNIGDQNQLNKPTIKSHEDSNQHHRAQTESSKINEPTKQSFPGGNLGRKDEISNRNVLIKNQVDLSKQNKNQAKIQVDASNVDQIDWQSQTLVNSSDRNQHQTSKEVDKRIIHNQLNQVQQDETNRNHHDKVQDKMIDQNQQEAQRQTGPGSKHQHHTKKGADASYENQLLSQKETEEINLTQHKAKKQADLGSQHKNQTQNQADVNNTKILHKMTQTDGKNTQISNKLTGKSSSVEVITRGLLRQSGGVELSKNAQVDHGGVKVRPVKNLSDSRASRSLDQTSKPEIFYSNFEIKQSLFNKISVSGEIRQSGVERHTQPIGKADLKEIKVPKPQFDSKKEGIRLVKDKQNDTMSDITKNRNDKLNLLKYKANANIASKIEVVDNNITSTNLKPNNKRHVSENKLSKGSPTITAVVEELVLTKSATKEVLCENLKIDVKRHVSENKLGFDSPTKNGVDEELPSTKSSTKEVASENLKPNVKLSVSDNKLSKGSPTKTAVVEELVLTKSSAKEVGSENLKLSVKRSVSKTKLSKDSPTKTAGVEQRTPIKSATKEVASENEKPTVKRSVSETKLTKDSPTKTAGVEKQTPIKSTTKEVASENVKPTVKRSVHEIKLSKDSPTKTAGVDKQPPTKSITKEVASENFKPTVKRSVSETKLSKDSPTKTAGVEQRTPIKSTTKEEASENVKPIVKRSVSETKLSKDSPTKTAGVEKQPPTKSITKEVASENFKPTVKRSVSETKLSKDSPTKTAGVEQRTPIKSATKEVASENEKPTVKRSVSETKLTKDSPIKTAGVEKQTPIKSTTKEVASKNVKPTVKRYVHEIKLSKDSPTKTAGVDKQPPTKSITKEVASENFKPTVKRSVSETKLSKDSPTKTAGVEQQIPIKSTTKEVSSENVKPTVKWSVSETKLSKDSPTKTAGVEKQPPTESATKEGVNENLKQIKKRFVSENKLGLDSPTKTAGAYELLLTKSATKKVASGNVKPSVKGSVSETKLSKDSPTKTAVDENLPSTKSSTKEVASENLKANVKLSVSETKLTKDSPTKTAGVEKQPLTKSMTKEVASENLNQTKKRSVSETKLSKVSENETSGGEKLPQIKSSTKKSKKKKKRSLKKQGDEESSNLWNSKFEDKTASLKDSRESANIKSIDSTESQSKSTISIQQLSKHENTQSNNEPNYTDLNPTKIRENAKNKESFDKRALSLIRPVENKMKPNISGSPEREQLKKINKGQEMKTFTMTKHNTKSVGLGFKDEESVAKINESKFQLPKYNFVQKLKNNKVAEVKGQIANIKQQNTQHQLTQTSEKTNLSLKKSGSLKSILETSRKQQSEAKEKSKTTLEKTTLNVLQVNSMINIKKDEPKSKASELNVNENSSLNKRRPAAKISAPSLPNIREKSRPYIERGKINIKVPSDSLSNDQKKTKSQGREGKRSSE